MVVIRQNLVASSKHNIKAPYSMKKPTTITVHNTSNDASADNEVRYMIRNDNKVSFHYAVDDKEIVQAVPDNRGTYHCGYSTGNKNSLSIEICYSLSGGDRFTQSEKNAAEFIASKLKEYGLTTANLTTHKAWNGKNCPHRTLEMGWGRFVNMVNSYMGGSGAVAPVQTVTTKPTTPAAPKDSWITALQTECNKQKYSNQTVDGIPGKITLAGCPTIKQGSRGNITKLLQQKLRDLGYYKGAIDGIFGAQTAAAVKAYQKAKGLTSDGIAGPNTWRKLLGL